VPSDTAILAVALSNAVILSVADTRPAYKRARPLPAVCAKLLSKIDFFLLSADHGTLARVLIGDKKSLRMPRSKVVDVRKG
jgi:hypothetical protein